MYVTTMPQRHRRRMDRETERQLAQHREVKKRCFMKLTDGKYIVKLVKDLLVFNVFCTAKIVSLISPKNWYQIFGKNNNQCVSLNIPKLVTSTKRKL